MMMTLLVVFVPSSDTKVSVEDEDEVDEVVVVVLSPASLLLLPAY